MVAGAILSGIETVGECMNDEVVSAFLHKCMNNEILPTIGDNEDSRKFANDVFDRFRNPYIKHKLRSIALNSVSKFSVRVLPTLLEFKEKNFCWPECMTMSLAYLIYFYKNDTPEDSAEVIEFMRNKSIAEILGNRDFWGQDISALTEIVTDYYEKIEKIGAKGAMKWIVTR
jgi:tagaturonate reductase